MIVFETCGGCGIKVVRARRSNGLSTLVDAYPHPWGNVLVRERAGLEPLAMMLAPQDRLKEERPLRLIHVCPFTRS